MALDRRRRFDIIGNMEALDLDTEPATQTVERLSALAHASRLAIYRLLVQAGPEGLAAGMLAARLGLPAPTLSFHLKELVQAGLAKSRPQSRFVIYWADFAAINGLIGYLTENCCGGNGRVVAATDCASACAPDACIPPPTRTRRSQ
jgi:ArsR family transcriptional regulator, arsenate/arsenite/antimonite-responsive transcriptional repressor